MRSSIEEWLLAVSNESREALDEEFDLAILTNDDHDINECRSPSFDESAGLQDDEG